MNEIYVVKVLEELKVNSPARLIGWEHNLKSAEELLNQWGSECRWSYACIEKVHSGMACYYESEAHWYEYKAGEDYDSSEFVPLSVEDLSVQNLELRNFFNIICHTLG